MDYNTGHASAQEIAADIAVPPARSYEDQFQNSSNTLTAAEIEFFKSEGYLVKRGVIDDSELFGQVIDHLWNHVPRQILVRDDPETWLDAPHRKWTEQDHEEVGLLHLGNWKMRSRGRIGTESFMVDGIANHPAMLTLVRQFLGENLKPVGRVRGIYAVLPKPLRAKGSLGPHSDYAAGQLGAMVVADHMPPGAGGFTVWPRSHTRLHECWDTCLGSGISDDKRDSYRDVRDAILRDTEPVETHGEPGDVVFWHHRLLHSAGVNRTADSKPLVRVIVPCDYQVGGKTYFDDEVYGPGERYQWWLDCRNFVEDEPPTSTNLWSGWAI